MIRVKRVFAAAWVALKPACRAIVTRLPIEAAAGAGEEQVSAVGGIDVEPGAVGTGGLGDLGQRVDEAAVGGAGKGSDEGGRLRELAAFEVPRVRCDNHQPLVRKRKRRGFWPRSG